MAYHIDDNSSIIPVLLMAVVFFSSFWRFSFWVYHPLLFYANV